MSNVFKFTIETSDEVEIQTLVDSVGAIDGVTFISATQMADEEENA